MKVVLRIIAILFCVLVLYTAWFALWFWSTGRIGLLTRSGALGAFTLLGWAAALIVGPYAFVQMWRLRRSGLNAAIFLAGFAVVYYLGGAFWFREPSAPIAPLLFAAAVNAGLLGVLILPSARRVCS